MTPDDTVDILTMRIVGWTVSNGALLKGKQTRTPNVNGEHGDGEADVLRRARDDKRNHVKGVKKERRGKTEEYTTMERDTGCDQPRKRDTPPTSGSDLLGTSDAGDE